MRAVPRLEDVPVTAHRVLVSGPPPVLVAERRRMIRTVGLGVAMGNALEEVKAVADVVTADNDADGIALAPRERFGLG